MLTARPRNAGKQVAIITQTMLAAIMQPSELVLQQAAKELCKRQGELDPNGIMQFRYQGQHFKLPEDKVALRAKPLYPQLIDEFAEVFQVYSIELRELHNACLYYFAEIFRIAKSHEDLLLLLPATLHTVIENCAYATGTLGTTVTPEQVQEITTKYAKVMDDINFRIFIGSTL